MQRKQMQGILFVALMGAAERRNIQAEIDAAEAKWQAFFERAKVRGTFEEKRNFYTAMWHLGIAPNNIAGVGEKPFYSTLSYWDTFRAAHPLFTVLAPERVTDMVNSSLRYYDANGFMPIWALWSKDNMCMIGTHSIPVAVDAYLKGFTVIAKNLSKENKYVKSVTLNGKPLDGFILKHADVMRGGELVFEMSR